MNHLISKSIPPLSADYKAINMHVNTKVTLYETMKDEHTYIICPYVMVPLINVSSVILVSTTKSNPWLLKQQTVCELRNSLTFFWWKDTSKFPKHTRTYV